MAFSPTAGAARACATASIAENNFRDFSGMDLPRADAPPRGAARAVRRVAARSGCSSCTSFGMARSGSSIPRPRFSRTGSTRSGNASRCRFCSRTGRRAPALPRMAERQVRQGRALDLRDEADRGAVQRGFGAPYRWKDSVQNPQRGPHVGGGRHRAGVPAVGDQVQCQAARPALAQAGGRPFRLALEERKVSAQRTAAGARGRGVNRARAADHNTGFYHALVEARIPFEMVPETQLDAAHVRQFRVLALPNIVNLSDAQCAQLKAFVENGGGLVATHETSLNDERGRRRADFGLAEVFGASFAGNVIERQQNAYLNLEDQPSAFGGHGRRGPNHPRREARRDSRGRGLARAADDGSHLSRSADGRGIPARNEDGHSRRDGRARWVRAALSTSRGTSTGRSGK